MLVGGGVCHASQPIEPELSRSLQTIQIQVQVQVQTQVQTQVQVQVQVQIQTSASEPSE